MKLKIIEELQQQLGAASPLPPTVRKLRAIHECKCAMLASLSIYTVRDQQLGNGATLSGQHFSPQLT